MNPKVFISYSHDSEEYKAWVKSFADRLISDGINAILDQYDLALGDMIPHFMEKGISESDIVLILVTKQFSRKADERKGGVGFETDLTTGEIFLGEDRRKFIPILIGIQFAEAPRFLKGKYGIRIANPFSYDSEYEAIYRRLKDQQHKKPDLGSLRESKDSVGYDPPFDISALRKRKDIPQYCSWDIWMELRSLADVSTSELFRRLQTQVRIMSHPSGYKEYNPSIFDPGNRKTTTPQVLFESQDCSHHTNQMEFEKLEIDQSLLRYSFIYFNQNQPGFHPIDFQRAEETLLQLLVMLMRVHVQMNRNPEILFTNHVESSFDAEFLPTDRPFKLNQNHFEWHMHPAGRTTTEYTVRRFDMIEEIENYFNSILETFISKSKASDKPFLAVDHESFKAFYRETVESFA